MVYLLDGMDAGVAEFVGDLGGAEEELEGFPCRSYSTGEPVEDDAAGNGERFWRARVIEGNGSAWLELADGAQGGTEGGESEVWDDAKPTEAGRLGWVEAGVAEAFKQGVVLEIERDVRKGGRDGDGGVGEEGLLPLLGGWEIDFEDGELREGVAVGEGIEAGPEDDVLENAGGNTFREAVFRIAAARGHEGAEVAADLVHGAFHVALKGGADETDGDGIVEYRRGVGKLVGGAANGDAQRGATGGSGLHVLLSLAKAPAEPDSMERMSWIVWALLAAVFAAATALLAKVGVAHVDSNLAMAVRTTVVVFFAWGIAIALGKHGEMRDLDRRTMMFLTLSGMATGLSWICYFRALQLGPASRVAPLDKMSVPLVMLFAWLLLGEKMDAMAIFGGVLITAGAVVMVLS